MHKNQQRSTTPNVPLFPVKKNEWTRLGFLALFKAMASFVFVILLSLKDSFLISAPGGGAEVIPALKGTGVMVISLLFVLLYTWLLGKYTPRQIAYCLIVGFVSFFVVYTFYLYPNADKLSPTQHAKALLAKYPNQKHWIALYRYWMHAIFYVVAELWAQIIIVLLFWTIVNDLYTRSQAKRLYHLLIAGGYMGGLFGTICQLHWIRIYGSYEGAVDVMLKTMVTVSWLLLCFYSFLDTNYLRRREPNHPSLTQQPTKGDKVSLLKSFKHVLSHPVLFAILAMVVASNVTTNLVDTTFKANAKALYPDKTDYLVFTIRILQMSILASIVLGLLISGNVMQRWGWRVSAYVQPVAVLVIGTLFLLSSKYKGSYTRITDYFNCTALHVTVGLGAIQHIIWKVAKYIFFDSTREMSYLYVDTTAKRKGKASIDLLGSRMSKGFGSIIHVVVLFLAKTINVLNVTTIILCFFLIFCLPWLYSVHMLGNHIEREDRISQQNKKKKLAKA